MVFDPRSINLFQMEHPLSVWYKPVRFVVSAGLLGVIIAGFLVPIPRINILEHTARNLYFHVPMWFTMMVATGLSAWHAYRYLRTGTLVHDIRSHAAARIGALFGLLGLMTGIWWSRYTWYQGTGVWWSFDPRQTFALIQLMIYAAYFILRSGMEDVSKRGRIAAVYNLFAFACVPFLLFILPRQLDSLHPGADGNPAFSDITHPVMRLVFYPAVILFIGLFWILYTQRTRLGLLRMRLSLDPDGK